jgi:Fic family protein
MSGLSLQGVTLAIILGTLAAIVYSLRILVLLERRIARVDVNIERLTRSVLREELKIEGAERRIQALLSAPKKKRTAKKKATKKKVVKKKVVKKKTVKRKRR